MVIPYLVAVLIGAVIALQAATISDATKNMHPLTVSLALLVAGLAVAGVWATLTDQWAQALSLASRWWWLPLGCAGWAIVAGLGWAAARLGIAVALGLVVAAQLCVGLLLGAIRGFPIGWRSLVGVALVVAGAALLNSGHNT